MNETEEYKLRWRGRVTGPFPVEEINRQLDEHEIGTGHEIFYQDEWITLEDFFKASQPPPPPPPPPTPPPAPVSVKAPTSPLSIPFKPSPVRVKVSVVSEPEPPRKKAPGPGPEPEPKPRRRLLFAFLAVFLGFLGVHNFYARQWLTGLLQLLLSVATYLMGFGIVASWLWAMVEAVFVRKDGDDMDMI